MVKRAPHWYLIYVWYCPMCGSTNEVRERQYGPKPEDPRDRYRWQEYACTSHFYR